MIAYFGKCFITRAARRLKFYFVECFRQRNLSKSTMPRSPPWHFTYIDEKSPERGVFVVSGTNVLSK